jgi:hypothetical protein
MDLARYFREGWGGGGGGGGGVFMVQGVTVDQVGTRESYGSKVLVGSLAWQFNKHVPISFCIYIIFVFLKISSQIQNMDFIRKLATLSHIHICQGYEGCAPTKPPSQ